MGWIEDKVKEARLRWFVHMMKMNDNDPVKLSWKEPAMGRRSRGTWKFTWRNGVERQMREPEEGNVVDRNYCYRQTRVADPARD